MNDDKIIYVSSSRGAITKGGVRLKHWQRKKNHKKVIKSAC